jgi:colanic acid/amylovoran biosynthesis glycosyltransferase
MAVSQRVVEAELGARQSEPRPRFRVLYIVSLFPCWSETFIVREIEELLARGVDVRIFSLKASQEKLVQSDARALEKYTSYPAGFIQNLFGALRAIWRDPIANFRMLAQIATDGGMTLPSRLKSLVVWWRVVGAVRWLEAWQPDLIHAHWATYPSTGAMMLSRILKIPFSFTAHAHDIFLEKHLLKEKLSAARFAVTISEYNRRLLLGLQPAAREKLHVIHCGIKPDELTYQEEGRDPSLLLAVGRLDEIKGFPTLVEACARLRERGLRFRCEIIGEGPLRQQLQNAIDTNGLGSEVRLCGAMPHEEVRARLYRAAVFVLPSVVTMHGNMDGIPVALMEAMACGTAVVSTTVSGIPELIEDGVNGYLAPPRDARALAERLASLLEDPGKRNAFARVARERVEQQFSVVAETGKLQQLFIASLDGN